jgi:hypothetical protein
MVHELPIPLTSQISFYFLIGTHTRFHHYKKNDDGIITWLRFFKRKHAMRNYPT